MGRVWHAPTLAPRSATEMVDALTTAAGLEPVKVGSLPRILLRAAGLFVPPLREMVEILYQFESPFVMASTETERELGLRPTPFDEQLAATIDGSH